MPDAPLTVIRYEVLRTVCHGCGHVISAISEPALFAGLMDHQERCPRG